MWKRFQMPDHRTTARTRTSTVALRIAKVRGRHNRSMGLPSLKISSVPSLLRPQVAWIVHASPSWSSTIFEEIATLRCGERLGSPMVDDDDLICCAPTRLLLRKSDAQRLRGEPRASQNPGAVEEGRGCLRWSWRDASQLLCHLMTRPSASWISSSRGLLA
jgi:hypothetical protein